MQWRLVFAKPHEDLPAFDFHFVRPGRLGRRHRDGRAGADIELRPVPRTGDRLPRRIDRPFAERPAVVRANVVERVKMPGRMNEHHEPLADLDQQAAGVGYLGRLCHRQQNSVMILASNSPTKFRQITETTPTTNSGRPSFSDFALRRRSSIRPDTTTRIPPAEYHKPATVTNRPTSRSALSQHFQRRHDAAISWISLTRRPIASPSASRTLSIGIRSNTCWKKPATIIRTASRRV